MLSPPSPTLYRRNISEPLPERDDDGVSGSLELWDGIPGESVDLPIILGDSDHDDIAMPDAPDIQPGPKQGESSKSADDQSAITAQLEVIAEPADTVQPDVANAAPQEQQEQSDQTRYDALSPEEQAAVDVLANMAARDMDTGIDALHTYHRSSASSSPSGSASPPPLSRRRAGAGGGIIQIGGLRVLVDVFESSSSSSSSSSESSPAMASPSHGSNGSPLLGEEDNLNTTSSYPSAASNAESEVTLIGGYALIAAVTRGSASPLLGEDNDDASLMFAPGVDATSPDTENDSSSITTPSVNLNLPAPSGHGDASPSTNGHAASSIPEDASSLASSKVLSLPKINLSPSAESGAFSSKISTLLDLAGSSSLAQASSAAPQSEAASSGEGQFASSSLVNFLQVIQGTLSAGAQENSSSVIQGNGPSSAQDNSSSTAQGEASPSALDSSFLITQDKSSPAAPHKSPSAAHENPSPAAQENSSSIAQESSSLPIQQSSSTSGQGPSSFLSTQGSITSAAQDILSSLLKVSRLPAALENSPLLSQGNELPVALVNSLRLPHGNAPPAAQENSLSIGKPDNLYSPAPENRSLHVHKNCASIAKGNQSSSAYENTSKIPQRNLSSTAMDDSPSSTRGDPPSSAEKQKNSDESYNSYEAGILRSQRNPASILLEERELEAAQGLLMLRNGGDKTIPSSSTALVKKFANSYEAAMLRSQRNPASFLLEERELEAALGLVKLRNGKNLNENIASSSTAHIQVASSSTAPVQVPYSFTALVPREVPRQQQGNSNNENSNAPVPMADDLLWEHYRRIAQDPNCSPHNRKLAEDWVALTNQQRALQYLLDQDDAEEAARNAAEREAPVPDGDYPHDERIMNAEWTRKLWKGKGFTPEVLEDARHWRLVCQQKENYRRNIEREKREEKRADEIAAEKASQAPPPAPNKSKKTKGGRKITQAMKDGFEKRKETLARKKAAAEAALNGEEVAADADATAMDIEATPPKQQTTTTRITRGKAKALREIMAEPEGASQLTGPELPPLRRTRRGKAAATSDAPQPTDIDSTSAAEGPSGSGSSGAQQNIKISSASTLVDEANASLEDLNAQFAKAAIGVGAPQKNKKADLLVGDVVTLKVSSGVGAKKAVAQKPAQDQTKAPASASAPAPGLAPALASGLAPASAALPAPALALSLSLASVSAAAPAPAVSATAQILAAARNRTEAPSWQSSGIATNWAVPPSAPTSAPGNLSTGGVKRSDNAALLGTSEAELRDIARHRQSGRRYSAVDQTDSTPRPGTSAPSIGDHFRPGPSGSSSSSGNGTTSQAPKYVQYGTPLYGGNGYTTYLPASANPALAQPRNDYSAQGPLNYPPASFPALPTQYLNANVEAASKAVKRTQSKSKEPSQAPSDQAVRRSGRQPRQSEKAKNMLEIASQVQEIDAAAKKKRPPSTVSKEPQVTRAASSDSEDADAIIKQTYPKKSNRGGYRPGAGRKRKASTLAEPAAAPRTLLPTPPRTLLPAGNSLPSSEDPTQPPMAKRTQAGIIVPRIGPPQSVVLRKKPHNRGGARPGAGRKPKRPRAASVSSGPSADNTLLALVYTAPLAPISAPGQLKAGKQSAPGQLESEARASLAELNDIAKPSELDKFRKDKAAAAQKQTLEKKGYGGIFHGAHKRHVGARISGEASVQPVKATPAASTKPGATDPLTKAPAASSVRTPLPSGKPAQPAAVNTTRRRGRPSANAPATPAVSAPATAPEASARKTRSSAAVTLPSIPESPATPSSKGKGKGKEEEVISTPAPDTAANKGVKRGRNDIDGAHTLGGGPSLRSKAGSTSQQPNDPSQVSSEDEPLIKRRRKGGEPSSTLSAVNNNTTVNEDDLPGLSSSHGAASRNGIQVPGEQQEEQVKSSPSSNRQSPYQFVQQPGSTPYKFTLKRTNSMNSSNSSVHGNA
ncbi:hypothetical protein B0H63DRAFT_443027 [Podospora didyma]|uniref:Uncharacterized protein n=1 Tax=Podospora didyma TaxID=330526 RepID=A0AAE0P3N8_9PEZI|nr:hypothetical protein B0H63DRAFT_443027 [Podospora didyma]